MDKVILMLVLVVLVAVLIADYNAGKAKALAPVATLTTEEYTHKCAYEDADFSDVKNGNVTFKSKICR